jgi:hypothetical protein
VWLSSLVACAVRLGQPDVVVGDGVARLPLVTPSTDRRRHYLPVEVDSLGPWIFFVDTGYSASTCDDDFIEGLGLRARGRSPVRGELGSLTTSKARLPPMSLGPHRVERLICQTRDLDSTSSIDDPPEVRVAGVIGVDVLRAFDVTIDGAWISLAPPESRPTPGPGVVRLRRERWVGGRVLIDVDIDGAVDRLLLDTGASDTYLDGERLGLEASAVERVTLRGTGAQGSAVRDVRQYDVAEVSLGGEAMGPVRLTDRPRGAFTPGLLGLDVLGDYRQEYYFGAGWARFTAAPRAQLPAWEDRPPGAVRVEAP